MNHLSTHVCNDDLRHYRFARTSGLPADYFHRPRYITVDGCVMAALAALVVVVVLATGSV